ncbi:MAG: PH domain-containing protein [Actinomycetota bacterium]
MRFPRSLLADHEKLVVDLRPHWIALVGPATVLVLVILAEILLFANFDPPSMVTWLVLLAGAVVLIAFPVRAFLAWVTSHFVVTTDRVIHRSGWLAKRSMEMPLERINDVTFTQSVFERVVGAGSLRIQSASEYGQNHFRDIRRPEDVQKLIYEMAEANEARMRGTGDARTETIETDADSPLDEIEQLARMKDEGIISEEEFETQKRRLLGRL